MKSYLQRKCRENRENLFACFKEKVTEIKFHENSRIKIPREFKAADFWKGRKICLKMFLIEQKTCNLLPQIEKTRKEKEKSVGDRKCKIGALLHFIGKDRRKKWFSKKLKVTGIKCRDKSDCHRTKMSQKTQDFNRNN